VRFRAEPVPEANTVQRDLDRPTGERHRAPASVLQPSIFDADADDAANYGAPGAPMGHELSHAFDDRGQGYDARGIPRLW